MKFFRGKNTINKKLYILMKKYKNFQQSQDVKIQ